MKGIVPHKKAASAKQEGKRYKDLKGETLAGIGGCSMDIPWNFTCRADSTSKRRRKGVKAGCS